MSNIKIDYSKAKGKIKPMHAVNNGPVPFDDVEQVKENFTAYKAAEIPYARTHDSSLCYGYGGEHCVDVHAVFPDFNKNPYDPSSYDFDLTDDYLKTIKDAGTEVFYRLGSKIEHWRKKYGTIVPADFNKWSVICEHIIRHYNCGWANGFHMDIKYWEIWNEPDGIKANGDQPNWSGTPEQFYELYKTAARHLKKCFPNLMIGGPACCCMNENWFVNFFEYINSDGQKTPFDFMSWHFYGNDPKVIVPGAERARYLLEKYGYEETETNLNEWNYLENWTDKFVSTLKAIRGMRGAAFTAAFMSVGQDSVLDMMMYYDARPTGFNGIFDPTTLETLKGYYPFVMFSKLYKLKNLANGVSDDEELYVTAAFNDTEKAAMITYYSTEKDKTDIKEVTVDFAGDTDGIWNVKTLSEDKTMEESTVTVSNGTAVVTLKPDTVILMEKQN